MAFGSGGRTHELVLKGALERVQDADSVFGAAEIDDQDVQRRADLELLGVQQVTLEGEPQSALPKRARLQAGPPAVGVDA